MMRSIDGGGANIFGECNEEFENQGSGKQKAQRWPDAPPGAQNCEGLQKMLKSVRGGKRLGENNKAGFGRSKENMIKWLGQFETYVCTLAKREYNQSDKGDRGLAKVDSGSKQKQKAAINLLFREDCKPGGREAGLTEQSLDILRNMRAWVNNACLYFLGQGLLSDDWREDMAALYESQPELTYWDWRDILVQRGKNLRGRQVHDAFNATRQNGRLLVPWLSGQNKANEEIVKLVVGGTQCVCCKSLTCVGWQAFSFENTSEAFKQDAMELAFDQTDDVETRMLNSVPHDRDKLGSVDLAAVIKDATTQARGGYLCDHNYNKNVGRSKEYVGNLRRTKQQWQQEQKGAPTPAAPKKGGGEEQQPKLQVCRQWAATGVCSYGSKCKFHHGGKVSDPPKAADLTRPVKQEQAWDKGKPKGNVCFDYENKGRCSRGAACRFAHEGSEERFDKTDKEWPRAGIGQEEKSRR